ncbi:MAG TPA: hypothetical protein K8V32_11825 [Enteractinococcus helveticum]|uniref:Uncharacterized protein n=1 Tax=Enteractinococcus helveticum TaxID=1837282 RepID=A0A921FQT6_9MICC|nr:hypothetical protein [Enteractinococcus helveticum]HJF15467.1 hypothetical protein [Enteractinococcus helveticum]
MPKDPTTSFMNDLNRELNNSTMGDSDVRLFKRELHAKMKRAEQGLLQYGKNAKTDDVYELIRSRRELLELRHDDVTTVDDSGNMVSRLSRLYFTERKSHDGELLAVAFYTKAPGPLGVEEQNTHIDSARGRLLSHIAQGR